MSSAADSSPITVGYWSIRGLAAPLRMMVMYSGRPLNNVMYNVKENNGSFDRGEWIDDAKPGLKERNALINLPFVIDGADANARVVTQSNACFSFLGRRLSLWGDNEDEIVQCEEFLCEIMDIRNSTVGFGYGGAADGSADLAVKFLANLTSPTSNFGKIELAHSRAMKSKDAAHAGYLVGAHATAPDFHLWEMMFQNKGLALHHGLADPFTAANGFPALEAWYNAFTADPRNAKYLASDLGDGRNGKEPIPFNQKMAKFGAAPLLPADPTHTGAAWQMGCTYSFNTYTGTY